MAYKIIREYKNQYQTGTEITAILDSTDDLADLGNEYAPGSIAMVADSGVPTYMLNASLAWVRI
ncbi:MAG: hypothetical protein ACI3V3_04235 [Faecousia sp.]